MSDFVDDFCLYLSFYFFMIGGLIMIIEDLRILSMGG